MGSTMEELVKLGRADVPGAAAALGQAFHDYPLLALAGDDPTKRERLAQAFCELGLYFAVQYGEAYATSAAFEGAAAWIQGDHFPMKATELLHSVPLTVLGRVARYGGGQLRRAGEHLDRLHRELAPPGHLVLYILGVAPMFQGRGFAGRLLRPVLRRLDRESRPCYVDTLNPSAVPMYEHFGFRVVVETQIPGTSLPAWALVRPPSPETQPPPTHSTPE